MQNTVCKNYVPHFQNLKKTKKKTKKNEKLSMFQQSTGKLENLRERIVSHQH